MPLRGYLFKTIVQDSLAYRHIGNLILRKATRRWKFNPQESNRLNLDLESHLPCNGVFQTVQRSICQFLEWEIDEQKCFKIENSPCLDISAFSLLGISSATRYHSFAIEIPTNSAWVI